MTDIGQTLREARMRSKIDIADVETATKIRAKYLRALENEEWSLLPGPTFVKSFLRTYAQYLGLDARMLVEEYKRRYERPEGSSEPFSAPRARDRERRGGPARGGVPTPPLLSPTALSVAGVVVVILVLLFVLGKWGSGGGGSGTGSAGSATTSTTARHRAKKRHHAATAPAKPKLASLRLVPTGSVYVCLIDNTGRKRVPGLTLTPSTPQHTYHAERFLMTVGNSQLQMVVNHKTLAVPPSKGATNYVITAAGRHTRPAGQGANCG